MMQLTITGVDYAPVDLHDQLPITVHLLREVPGSDRPDYWIGAVETPIEWNDRGVARTIRFLVLAARWTGTRIEQGCEHLPVGIAFVTDESLLDDARIDFGKLRYVAIGIATETSERGPKR